MPERAPIFLFSATGIGILWAAYFAIFATINGIHPDQSGGNIGGYELEGIGPFLIVAGSSAALGFGLSFISLLRKEKHRKWAWTSLCLYFLPGLGGLWILITFGKILIDVP